MTLGSMFKVMYITVTLDYLTFLLFLSKIFYIIRVIGFQKVVKLNDFQLSKYLFRFIKIQGQTIVLLHTTHRSEVLPWVTSTGGPKVWEHIRGGYDLSGLIWVTLFLVHIKWETKIYIVWWFWYMCHPSL